MLAQPVIGLDQTSWPRLDGKGDKPWQMWCLTAPGVVVHRIRDDKSADTFRDLMGGYAGKRAVSFEPKRVLVAHRGGQGPQRPPIAAGPPQGVPDRLSPGARRLEGGWKRLTVFPVGTWWMRVHHRVACEVGPHTW